FQNAIRKPDLVIRVRFGLILLIQKQIVRHNHGSYRKRSQRSRGHLIDLFLPDVLPDQHRQQDHRNDRKDDKSDQQFLEEVEANRCLRAQVKRNGFVEEKEKRYDQRQEPDQVEKQEIDQSHNLAANRSIGHEKCGVAPHQAKVINLVTMTLQIFAGPRSWGR